MKLNPGLKTQLKTALQNYHQVLWAQPPSRELDFIDQTVASFNKFNFSAGNQVLQTQSKRIHLKPMVRFSRRPLLFPRKYTTVEMGDLIFIYKHVSYGVLDEYRASIVQVKYTKEKPKSWRIDPDQFYFLTRWPRFKVVRLPSKTTHHFKPRTLTWASYGFVGPNATRYPLYYSSKRMLYYKKMITPDKPFNFPAQPGIGWDSSTSFYLKFIQGYVGENLFLSSKVRSFVDDVYVVSKWKPDPPGELEWNDEKNEENEGFGAVEFTVTTEQREK